MTIELRALTVDDVMTLQQISRQTFTDTFGVYNTPEDLEKYLQKTYNVARLSQELANQNSCFFFILVDQEIAGYLKLNTEDAQTESKLDEALEIERIYVLPSFKRMGLGKQLVEQAQKVARAANKKVIWLGVWEENYAALAFYDKMGFTAFSDHEFVLGDDVQRDVLMKLMVM